MASRKKSATIDLKVRMKEPLRAQIASAARRKGISLNAEVVDRLERSIQNDEAMGGAELYALFRILGAAANFLETKTGKKWSEDIETYFAVKEAWRPIIEAASPPMTLELMNKLEAVERRPPPPPSMPEKDAKAQSDYESQMRKYRRDMKAYQRSVKEADDLSDELTKLGRGVAAGLLRTEGKK